jgi:hypothetical protein
MDLRDVMDPMDLMSGGERSFQAARPRANAVASIRPILIVRPVSPEDCVLLIAEACVMMFHDCGTDQREAILKTHHIPLKHIGRTVLVLVSVISTEKRIAQTRLFGSPAFNFARRTRHRLLLLAPCNAGC